MQRTNQLIIFCSVLLLGACAKKKEKISDTYHGLKVTSKLNYLYQDSMPLVNYQQYLNSGIKEDSKGSDFIVIDYKGKLLTVNKSLHEIEFGPSWVGTLELFKVIELADGQIALMDYEKNYLSLQKDKKLKFNTDSIGQNAKFNLIPLENDQYAILASNELFLSSEDAYSVVTASRKEIGKWETFTIHKLLPPQ